MSVEGFIRKSNISRGVSDRPILLSSQAVALILRALGILTRLAVAMQTILVHPVAWEVLRWLDLTTCATVLQKEAATTLACYEAVYGRRAAIQLLSQAAEQA